MGGLLHLVQQLKEGTGGGAPFKHQYKTLSLLLIYLTFMYNCYQPVTASLQNISPKYWLHRSMSCIAPTDITDWVYDVDYIV